jgi:hypothetical protein
VKCQSDHVISPRVGAMFYRPHIDDSSVKFHNTLLFINAEGSTYTVDSIVTPDTGNCTATLLLTSDGEISGWNGPRCDLPQVKTVGCAIQLLFSPSDHTSITNAVQHALTRKSLVSLHSTLLGASTYDATVWLNFYHRVDGKVVVLVNLVLAVTSSTANNIDADHAADMRIQVL